MLVQLPPAGESFLTLDAREGPKVHILVRIVPLFCPYDLSSEWTFSKTCFAQSAFRGFSSSLCSPVETFAGWHEVGVAEAEVNKVAAPTGRRRGRPSATLGPGLGCFSRGATQP